MFWRPFQPSSCYGYSFLPFHFIVKSGIPKSKKRESLQAQVKKIKRSPLKILSIPHEKNRTEPLRLFYQGNRCSPRAGRRGRGRDSSFHRSFFTEAGQGVKHKTAQRPADTSRTYVDLAQRSVRGVTYLPKSDHPLALCVSDKLKKTSLQKCGGVTTAQKELCYPLDSVLFRAHERME